MGMIDLQDIYDTNDNLKRAYNRVNPFFVPRILVKMAAGQISMKYYKLFGQNHAVSTVVQLIYIQLAMHSDLFNMTMLM